jgi:hypothetical protein
MAEALNDPWFWVIIGTVLVLCALMAAMEGLVEPEEYGWHGSKMQQWLERLRSW